MGALHRSCVQFHGHEKKKKKTKDKTQMEAQKQVKAFLGNRKIAVGRKTTAAGAERSHNFPGEATTVVEAADIEEGLYQDDTDVIVQEVPTFSKRRVASAEEIANSGQFQSKLCEAIATAKGSPIANEPAIEDNFSDSPSQSLVLLAPVYKAIGDELVLQSRAAPAPETELSPPETPKHSPSSSSLLQALVKLFAGRKNVSKSVKSRQHHKSYPAFPNAPTNTNPYKIQQTASERAANHPPIPSPPKLTHQQVIPLIRHPGAEDLSAQPGFREIPSAPAHRHTGSAVTAKDIFKPASILRGFDLSPPLLAHRRNHSAGNLLDRNGDVWAKWHTKYTDPESYPFSRPQPAGV